MVVRPFCVCMSGWLGQWVAASGQILEIVAFALILILVFLGLGMVGRLIEATIRLIMLGWLNRLLGAVFALVKWLLVMGLLAVAFNSINETLGLVKPEVLAHSHLYPILTDIAETVFPYLKNLLTA